MKITTIIKIALGILVLGILFVKIGIKETATTITSMNYLYLPPIIILFVSGLFLGAYNLKILTDALGIRISMRKMTGYYLISWAFGLVIPGKIGEFSFVYLARKQLSLGQGSAVAVLDKIITVYSLCILAFFGLFIFFPFDQAIKLTAAITALNAIGLIFVLSSPGRIMARKILGKFGEKFSGFSRTLFLLVLNRKQAVAINFALTFLKWGITAVVTNLIFLSLGKSINPLIILTISATIMLLSLIPITMSGLGIKEGAAVFLYGQIGVAAEITMAAHIILLILNYAGAAAVFLFLRNDQ
ncbi:flippase-like domain-containing protein [Candidatus Woesearchaeota archaeon]|nr:flippase-like domain-containing protein [Candidatus Woesearchaeota archaeon]